MKAKLVKESLYESTDCKLFMINNHEKIVAEYVEKFRKIFKGYLPWNESEDALEDCSTIWWMKIVEPGWEPIILRKLSGDRFDNNECIELENECVDEALKILGLPREIIE